MFQGLSWCSFLSDNRRRIGVVTNVSMHAFSSNSCLPFFSRSVLSFCTQSLYSQPTYSERFCETDSRPFKKDSSWAEINTSDQKQGHNERQELWANLAKTTQRQLTARKRSERTKPDFRFSICRLAIGQVEVKSDFRSARAVLSRTREIWVRGYAPSS